METTTTLSFKDSRSGTSARGPWTLSIFAGGDGREYTTLKGDVASAAKALEGKLAVVTYSERQNTKDGRTYTNYSLEGVTAAPEGAVAAAPVAQSGGGGGGKGEFRSPEQIIRTAALTQAVEAFAAAQLDPISDQVGLLQTAVVFEAYITEGIEEEPEA